MAERLTDKKKKEIIAYYVECQNYSEVARKYNVADNTVRHLVISNEEIAKKLEQKNEENTKSVLEAMESRKDKKIKLLDKILDAMDSKAENLDMFTNIKDLATAYGIIMDKEIKIRELENNNKDKTNEKTLEKLDEVLNKMGGVI